MVIRLIKSVRHALLFRKAFDFQRRGDIEKSLYYLDKCRNIFGEDKIQASLLRSLIFYEAENWEDALFVSHECIKKIDRSTILNNDEKKYLKAFSTDTINCVILKTQENPKFIPVDMSFNRELVDGRYKNRFIVKSR